MSLNEEDIFENVSLVVVKLKSGTMKVVNIKFPKKKILLTFVIGMKYPASFIWLLARFYLNMIGSISIQLELALVLVEGRSKTARSECDDLWFEFLTI